MNQSLVLRAILLATTLLSASLAGGQKYSGPKCLGLYCIDRDTLVSDLLKKLGLPPARSSEFAPYCYESQEQKAINVYRVRTPENRPLDEAPRLKVNNLESEI